MFILPEAPPPQSECVGPVKQMTIVTAFLDLESTPWSNSETRARQAGHRRLHIEGDASRNRLGRGEAGHDGVWRQDFLDWLTMTPSGTVNLLSSLVGPPSLSRLGSTVERDGARGKGPSPRCLLVTWASGPCTVLTCLRSELGSV